MSLAKQLIEDIIEAAPKVSAGKTIKAYDPSTDYPGTFKVKRVDKPGGETLLTGDFISSGPNKPRKGVYAGWDPHDKQWLVADDKEDITG